jgi:hypothetical protein
MDKIKEMAERLKQRMYGLVPYNISPIQQGIQFGHAVVEYGLSYGHKSDDPYLQWARNDKTFIILNGGTTNNNKECFGTLNNAQIRLYSMGVQNESFCEPDLGDQLTAVVFLVDERVWDREKYPEFMKVLITDHINLEKDYYKQLFGKDYEDVLEMRDFLSQYKLA